MSTKGVNVNLIRSSFHKTLLVGFNQRCCQSGSFDLDKPVIVIVSDNWTQLWNIYGNSKYLYICYFKELARMHGMLQNITKIKYFYFLLIFVSYLNLLHFCFSLLLAATHAVEPVQWQWQWREWITYRMFLPWPSP